MSSSLEPPNNFDQPIYLSSQQILLHKALTAKDGAMAKCYLGALYVLNQQINPDRFPLAAHNLRELIEKIPKLVGRVSEVPNIAENAYKISSAWEKYAVKSKCKNKDGFDGEIDGHLQNFLKESAKFVAFLSNRPTRRTERTETLRGLDPGPIRMPANIEANRVRDLEEYSHYFTTLSHHRFETTADVFESNLYHFERFLIDYLCPRTFDDHEALDNLIRSAEKK